MAARPQRGVAGVHARVRLAARQLAARRLALPVRLKLLRLPEQADGRGDVASTSTHAVVRVLTGVAHDVVVVVTLAALVVELVGGSGSVFSMLQIIVQLLAPRAPQPQPWSSCVVQVAHVGRAHRVESPRS